MSDLKLFKLSSDHVTELTVSSMALEKSLQSLIEKHLGTFLWITFLASEFPAGPKTGGRMDTLGIDENGAPVIIEYKKATNANVINQGLFYLDWLLDHDYRTKGPHEPRNHQNNIPTSASCAERRVGAACYVREAPSPSFRSQDQFAESIPGGVSGCDRSRQIDR